MAPKWSSTPSSPAQLPAPTKSPQHSHASTGGAQPKGPAVPSHGQSCSWSQTRPGRGRLDHMKCPYQWIVDEMSQPSSPHPHWWREVKASGWTSLGANVVQEKHSDFVAQQYALRQVAAYRLPVAHQEALVWWNTQPAFHGHCPQNVLPPTTASDPPGPLGLEAGKDAGFSPSLTGMCRGTRCQDRHSLWGSQRTPAVYGPFDDPQWGKYCRGLPTEAYWRGTGSLPHSRRGGHPPGWRRWASASARPYPRYLEIPRFVEPAEQTTTPVTSAAPCLTSEPYSCPSQKGKKLWEGIDVDPITLASGSKLTWGEIAGSQSSGRNFILLSTLQTGVVMMPKSSVWLAGKLWPSTFQPPRRRYWHLDHPNLPCSTRKVRIPYPKRPMGNPGLSGGMERREGSTGCCVLEVCYPCQSLSKCILWSGAEALQMPSACGRGWQPLQYGDRDIGGG